MKKVIKILSALAMAVCLLVCATGCVSADWQKTKENLVAEKYNVSATVNTDALSATKIKAGLVAVGLAKADTDPIYAYIYAIDDGKFAHFFYCDNGEIAKELYEALDAKLPELLDTYDIAEKDAKLGKSGRVVYFGYKEVIKAA